MITWRDFKSSEQVGEIPPFSVVELIDDYSIGGGSETIIHVEKPNASGSGIYAITSPHRVTEGGKGTCTFDDYAVAAYDPAGQLPSIGDVIGPSDDSWVLSSGGSGFQVAGSPDTERNTVRVVRFPTPGGAGITHLMARVNEPAGLDPFMLTFAVDDVVPISGETEVPTELEEVHNSVGGIHGDDEWVMIVENLPQQRWELVNDGQGASQMIGVTYEEIPAADWDHNPPRIYNGEVDVWSFAGEDETNGEYIEIEQLSAVKQLWYNPIPLPIIRSKIVVATMWGRHPMIIMEGCPALG